LARQLHDALEDDLLVIDQVELGVVLQHADDGILQALRGLDASVVDLVDDPAVVTGLDHALDVFAQLHDVALRERGGVFQVVGVYRVVQRIVGRSHVVVQVGARPEPDTLYLRVLVIVANHLRVAPCLVGRVHDAAVGAARERFNQTVEPFHLVQLFPLLQLDNHDVRTAAGIVARDQEVHALGRVGQVVLDGHTRIARDAVVVQHLVHVLERVNPRPEFRLARLAVHLLQDVVADAVRDGVVLDFRHEVGFASAVDDHGRSVCFPLFASIVMSSISDCQACSVAFP